MPDRETFFITGFPGFIANRLLERLARQECDFILLVQPSLAARAGEEIARIASLAGRSVAEFQIVEGDIAESQLALKKSDLDLVQQEATRVFHLAAVYDLAVPQDLALRVNVGGTRNVVAVARSRPSTGSSALSATSRRRTRSYARNTHPCAPRPIASRTRKRASRVGEATEASIGADGKAARSITSRGAALLGSARGRPGLWRWEIADSVEA